MNIILILIPVALMLGGIGLAAFLWALKNGQFEDLDGAAQRVLIDDEDDIQERAAAKNKDRSLTSR